MSARLGSELTLTGCSFANCTVGLDLSDNCAVTLENVTFDEGEDKKLGVRMEVAELQEEGKMRLVYKSFSELPAR